MLVVIIVALVSSLVEDIDADRPYFAGDDFIPVRDEATAVRNQSKSPTLHMRCTYAAHTLHIRCTSLYRINHFDS